MTEEWMDLNLSTELCPHLSVNDALCELVMNAIDAAPDKVPEFSALDSSTIVLRDQGEGLRLESFTVGRTVGDKVVGRFGVGLKDAVAVLMRNKAQIEIDSHLGSYRFEVKPGVLGTNTIHIQRHKACGNTIITVSKLQDAHASVKAVKKLFLCFSHLKLLYTKDDFQVLLPEKQTGKNRGCLFVNGVAVKVPQSLFLSYNFKNATMNQRRACDRDHNVDAVKFKKFFKETLRSHYSRLLSTRSSSLRHHRASLAGPRFENNISPNQCLLPPVSTWCRMRRKSRQWSILLQ
eukprot:m.88462 g.88462  ORF g.88462 m.88462 type:complete len:291 (-) comp8810_c0_seq3:1410-2282(-)